MAVQEDVEQNDSHETSNLLLDSGNFTASLIHFKNKISGSEYFSKY